MQVNHKPVCNEHIDHLLELLEMGNKSAENEHVAEEIRPLEDTREEGHEELDDCIASEARYEYTCTEIKHPPSTLGLCLHIEYRVEELLLEPEDHEQCKQVAAS